MSKAFKLNIGGVTNWYDHFVAADIELIAAYIEQCEISNNIAITEYHKYFKEEIEKQEYGQNSCTIHFRGIDGHTFNAEDIYTNVFPMLNRHSTLIMVMSMFEKRLMQLCDWLNTHFNLSTSFKKGKGSLLKQIKMYLTNIAGLKFNTVIEDGWSELMALQSIRNNIVHNFGQYVNKNKYMDTYVQENKNISINEYNEFIFNHVFLKDLVPNFNILCKGLQQVIRNKSNSN